MQTTMARRKFDRRLLPKKPNLKYERVLWVGGTAPVAGVDEAGRGALAGPVYAAAAILPQDAGVAKKLSGVRDSKQMTPAQREEWDEKIRQLAAAWGIGLATPKEIDALGIVPATHLAAERALDNMGVTPRHILFDALELPSLDIEQTSLIKGDQRSLSIACASVLAKVERDKFMLSLAGEYPKYGFAAHKGYGTAAHRRALEDWGPCQIHRFSFAPMREN
jgi:ribonuclease HII